MIAFATQRQCSTGAGDRLQRLVRKREAQCKPYTSEAISHLPPDKFANTALTAAQVMTTRRRVGSRAWSPSPTYGIRAYHTFSELYAGPVFARGSPRLSCQVGSLPPWVGHIRAGTCNDPLKDDSPVSLFRAPRTRRKKCGAIAQMRGVLRLMV